MFLKHDARSSSSNRSDLRDRAKSQRRWLGMTLLAGAVAATVGAPYCAFAQDATNSTTVVAAAQQPQMSSADRYAKGVDEFKKNQYEESLADLQQVNADDLNAGNRRDLSDYLKRAEASANERRAARAEFEQGEQSLAAGRLPEASTHYRAAMNNRYADDGTKAKSREQIAVVDATMKQSAQSQKDLYTEAIGDYKANNLDAARAKFDQLDKGGFKAGLFQRSPGDYVKDIDKRLATSAPPSGVVPMPLPAVEQTPPPPAPVVQAPPPPMPAPLTPEPVVQAPPAPPPAPVIPQPEPAPAPIVAQQPAPPPPVFVPPPPAPVVAQPAPAPIMPAPQPAAPAPVFAQTPAPPLPPPSAPAMDAKTAYHMGQEQFRSGDWISARRNFETARDMNYKPGLFEGDAPSRYLARMDDKEQHDAALAADQARANGQTAVDQTQAAQNRAMAQQLVQQAETARAADRLDEALALYMKASDLDPSNTAALNGRNELAATLQRTTGRPDLLTDQQVRNDQQRSYINYTFQTAIDAARKSISAQDFTEAQNQISRAQVARNINAGVFTEQELHSFDATITQTQLSRDQAVEAKRLSDEQASRDQGQLQLREQERQRQTEVAGTVSNLIRQSRELVDQGKYEEALGVLDQILKLDPNNDYAQGVRPLVYDRAIVLEQRRYRESYDRNVVRQYTAAEEEKIPYSDILKYPDNWPDLSAMRDKTVSAERGEHSDDEAVYAQLERKLPDVNLNNVAFSDVVEFLRDVSGANLYVNWRALEAAGVDRNAQVSARVKNVKFSKILDTILHDVGGAAVKLAYTVNEGVITISTEDDLSSNVVTRVYDIRDLIVSVEDFDQPPQFNIQQNAGGGRGGGGGGQLFNSVSQQTTNQANRQALTAQMITLVEDIVSSESWKDRGGTVGSIRDLPGSGQLIVTQTPENQRKLRLLLDQLRETRAIQITIETRFLTVQRNFLEEVGVDFDFLANTNHQLLGNVGPIGIQNNSDAFTGISNLQTGIPGNIGANLSATSASATGITPNFSITGSNTLGTSGGAVTFLDDFQVGLLLRATQISQNTTTLTAPRMTLFNGQRAFFVVATQTAYVSDVTPVIATGAVAFDPTITNQPSGVLLDVQATVSADRKYVTLTLRPVLSRLRSLVSFPVSAIVNTAATATGGTGTTQITSANVQEPITDVTVINTTVSVPDGGTLLLGGQTLAGEIELESGVPILSKIPFLKRLFTNSSTAKDEQILLILVKPTIVIQREKEQEQFPLMNSKLAG